MNPLQRKKQTTNAMGAVDNMGDVLLGKSDKDTNITLDSPKLKMQIAKVGGENGEIKLTSLIILSSLFLTFD